MQLTIEEEPKWCGFGAGWLATAFIESIREHCLEHENRFQDVFLKLSIHRAESREQFSTLKLSLSGTINGRAFREICSATRSKAHGSAGGLVGCVVSELVSRTVTTALQCTLAQDPDFVQCYAENLATLQAAIDQAAGVEPSVLAKKWNRLQLLGKLLFAGSFLVAIPVVIFAAPRRIDLANLPAFGLLSLLLGVAVGTGLNFLVWSTGLLFFPDRFYFDEPIGRRVLARTGLQTPQQVRILIGLIFTALIALGAFIGLYSLAD